MPGRENALRMLFLSDNHLGASEAAEDNMLNALETVHENNVSLSVSSLLSLLLQRFHIFFLFSLSLSQTTQISSSAPAMSLTRCRRRA